MTVYVAFLRAINLGPRRRFAKEAIVAATEAAGFTEVATHINTGNVRLETAMRSRARIEERLEAAYLADRGFDVPTVVFGRSELRAVVEDAAQLGGERWSGQFVSLLKAEPSDDARAALEARSSEVEQIRVRGRAVHQLLAVEYHLARVANTVVERHVEVATNRNLTVLRAIVEKWC